MLVFPKEKTPEFTKKWARHSYELFVLALSLVWFAGATPDLSCETKVFRPGQEQHPGQENQDSQHMLNLFPGKKGRGNPNPGGLSLNKGDGRKGTFREALKDHFGHDHFDFGSQGVPLIPFLSA